MTLIVKDDDGGLGFGNAATHFVSSPYAFSGFTSPVEDRPTVNKANAGSAIPVKFSLGGDEGRTIFDPGYPKAQRIDCQSGADINEIPRRPRRGPAADVQQRHLPVRVEDGSRMGRHVSPAGARAQRLVLASADFRFK